ncbi:CDF family Co(II)/Ni(II) efflux transporter DmeF [Aromatoleum toluvorans]|uniref:CDF family Co(II)/Ni(II) efflux transporter DmeF n=1 Tax=Aromatoleum toluvorans TaxID=92002 RepID=A0ABX1PZZ3_9RHOO|nr:CDF family Co(II)/Ni(II) efflux transporter DmeF [Aromatoleum toluvorans]NMG45003.1 CDF family Co(II)/Ni(II) efflux transporter DmeF [Aromatoleum toluvorans]
MSPESPQYWTSNHSFDDGNVAGERGTRLVLVITAITMVVEIAAGWWFNSMALLADGWHMSSHALAIGLSALAYAAARRYADDPRFAFGTWKIEILAGFASAIFLVGVALAMVIGSVERLLAPQAIRFHEAIAVAVLGLVVNIVCALILARAGEHSHGGHGHGHHGHDHAHAHDHHDHHHHDLNLRAAYLHVVVDAATSVLAIVALLGGMLYGWNWLDPVMGIVGAVLVARWSRGLLRDTGRVLLDREMDHPVVGEIREALARHPHWPEAPRIVDLHVWRVGRNRFAAIVGVLSGDPTITPTSIKRALAPHEELIHISVEVNRPQDAR